VQKSKGGILRCCATACDIVKIFPAPGKLCPLPPGVTPLITARSDARQQTMVIVLSSNQRHTKVFGFGGCKIFNSP